MQGLPFTISLFRSRLINSIKHEHSCKIHFFKTPFAENSMNLFLRLSREILLHAVSSGDKVFKTIRPRSAMMECWSLSGSKYSDSMSECIFRLVTILKNNNN